MLNVTVTVTPQDKTAPQRAYVLHVTRAEAASADLIASIVPPVITANSSVVLTLERPKAAETLSEAWVAFVPRGTPQCPPAGHSAYRAAFNGKVRVVGAMSAQSGMLPCISFNQVDPAAQQTSASLTVIAPAAADLVAGISPDQGVKGTTASVIIQPKIGATINDGDSLKLVPSTTPACPGGGYQLVVNQTANVTIPAELPLGDSELRVCYKLHQSTAVGVLQINPMAKLTVGAVVA